MSLLSFVSQFNCCFINRGGNYHSTSSVWNNLSNIGLDLLWISGRILLWNHLAWAIFVGIILITATVSLRVIDILTLLISSWFHFGKLCIPRKLHMSFKFPIFWSTGFLSSHMIILWIFSVSVVMFSFSFFILLICIFSLCNLVSLDKNSYILLLFSWNQLFVSIIYYIVFFVSTLWISAFNLICWCLIPMEEFDSFTSRVFRCAVKSPMGVLHCFYVAL